MERLEACPGLEVQPSRLPGSYVPNLLTTLAEKDDGKRFVKERRRLPSLSYPISCNALA